MLGASVKAISNWFLVLVHRIARQILKKKNYTSSNAKLREKKQVYGIKFCIRY